MDARMVVQQPQPQLNHQLQLPQLPLEPMEDVGKILVAPPAIRRAVMVAAVRLMGTLYILLFTLFNL
jgi:hypothetical protein